MTAKHLETEDGCLLSYEDSGEGFPVLWQHGLGADRKQPAEVFPVMPGIRRLTLECRGHGDSQLGDHARLSIASFQTDALAFLDYLGIRQAVVGGISLGAAVAMRLAALHPNRIAGLVLARPAWVVGPSLSSMAPYLEIADLLSRFGPLEGAKHFELSESLARVAAVSSDNAESLKSFFTKPDHERTIALLSTIPKDSPGVKKKDLEKISTPTLIVGNHEDFVHPLAYAECLQRIIPHAAMTVITSKSINKDRYKLDFKGALSRFLMEMAVVQ